MHFQAAYAGGMRLRHKHRVLQHRHMAGDVRVVVLVNEGFGGLSSQKRHVFADWITRLHVVSQRNQLVGVLNA